MHADCESEDVAVVLFAVSLFAVATVKLLHLHHLPMFDCRMFFGGNAGEHVLKVYILCYYVISHFSVLLIVFIIFNFKSF